MARLEQPQQKLTTPRSLALDAVLVVAFFIYIYSVMKVHVPSEDPHMIMLWGAITASLMTALFWLALQMFRVVLRFQIQERKAAAAAKKS